MSEIFKVRKDIADLHKDYDFFRRSYEGGTVYKDGNFLIKHERETQKDYERRQEQASYMNLCSDVVDIYTSYLYREEPTRTFDSNDPIVDKESPDSFLSDADLEGRPWRKVVREISKMAGYYGAMGAIIDKPAGEGEQSKAAELAKGIRPYVAAYTPLAIWDWAFTSTDGRTLSELVLQEDNDGGPTLLKRWFRNKWELWEQKEGDSFDMKEEGTYPLKVIPFVLLRNRDSMKKMTGISDIVDIAPLNRRIYYLDSDALEIIDRTAVPIPEMGEDSVPKTAGETGEVQGGTGNVMVRSNEDKIGFQWIEPPHSSLKVILDWREQSVKDILSIAKTSQGQATQTEAKSGVALEIEFQELNAKISEKAFNAEDFEYRVFRLVGLWQGIDLGAMIAYAKKFGIKDLAHQIETAISAKSAVPSRTYQSEVSKGIVKATLPKDTDPKIIEEIEKELDQVQPEVPEVNDNGE